MEKNGAQTHDGCILSQTLVLVRLQVGRLFSKFWQGQCGFITCHNSIIESVFCLSQMNSDIDHVFGHMDVVRCCRPGGQCRWAAAASLAGKNIMGFPWYLELSSDIHCLVLQGPPDSIPFCCKSLSRWAHLVIDRWHSKNKQHSVNPVRRTTSAPEGTYPTRPQKRSSKSARWIPRQDHWKRSGFGVCSVLHIPILFVPYLSQKQIHIYPMYMPRIHCQIVSVRKRHGVLQGRRFQLNGYMHSALQSNSSWYELSQQCGPLRNRFISWFLWVCQKLEKTCHIKMLCCILLKSIQSRNLDMMRTCLSGSYGRFSFTSMNPCRECWKAAGVRSCWLLFSHVAMLLKQPSISSWLWPEDKNDRVHSLMRPRATWVEAHWSSPLFFNSLLALSPWRTKWVDLRSYPFWLTSVSPWEMISMLRLELQVTKCGDKIVNARNPCIKSVVELNRGLDQLANSFAFIVVVLGHECFAASILSMIAVTTAGQELEPDKRLRLRLCQ